MCKNFCGRKLQKPRIVFSRRAKNAIQTNHVQSNSLVSVANPEGASAGLSFERFCRNFPKSGKRRKRPALENFVRSPIVAPISSSFTLIIMHSTAVPIE
jgi:hypothetical protein